MNRLSWSINSLRQRGLGRTLQVATSYIADYWFDFTYGTDTARRMEVRDMDFQSESKAHSSCYGATKARPFAELMRQLQPDRSSVLVDVGCGKGRVLMLGALNGFKHVVGLEFAPELCRIARRNWDRFEAKEKTGTRMELIEGDAAQHEFRNNESIVFMFNPFGPAILEKVVANFRRSVEDHPRPCWWIYLAPRYADVVNRSGLFPAGRQMVVKGAEYRVWHRA